jgi:Cft2 family RNA processing exonuclease
MARKQPVAAALTFHGAAGTVTGSKYLLEANGARILVDCVSATGSPGRSSRRRSTPCC